jgi:hypothetical protein
VDVRTDEEIQLAKTLFFATSTRVRAQELHAAA